jgi:hypothetical protein
VGRNKATVHTMKVCGMLQVWLHSFLTMAVVEMNGQLNAVATLPMVEVE